MPYGDTRASWLLVGPHVELRQTAYDLGAAAERVRRTDYPLAEDFATGNILQAPSEEEALATFSRAVLT